MGKRGKSESDSAFKSIETVLKKYKHFKTYIKIFELNKKLHAGDKEYIKKIDKNIEYYRKMDLNVKRCLDMLNEYEVEFIQEKYYNNKSYRELIPLINKIVYGDENINKKINIGFSTLINNGSTVKKIILTKLLNENILGVDKIC